LGPGWTPPAPLAPDDLPSLQSAPTLALAGDRALLGWVDSRTAAPDLYTAFWQGDQPGGEVRATNLTPHFSTQRVFGAAVAVESSGRAFAVYADGEQIYLVRYDPATARWSAPVQVTQGLTEWHAVARAPQIVTDGAGALVVAWEDFRNANPDNDWAESKGSDIYVARCDGAALTCTANRQGEQRQHTGRSAPPAPQPARQPGGADLGRSPRVRRRGATGLHRVVERRRRDVGRQSPRPPTQRRRPPAATARPTPPSPSPPTVRSLPLGSITPAPRLLPPTSMLHSGTARPGAQRSASMPRRNACVRWRRSRWQAATPVSSSPGRITARGEQSRHLRRTLERRRLERAGCHRRARDADTAGVGCCGESRARRLAGHRCGQPDIFTATWQGSAWSGATLANTAAARTPYQMAPTLTSLGGATTALFLDNRQGYRELWSSTLPLVDSAGRRRRACRRGRMSGAI
jgi:hypothetical protein